MSAADDRSTGPTDIAEVAKIAIVCGSGTLPFAVAQSAVDQGRAVMLIGLRGAADPARLAGYPHAWIRPGQFGRCVRLARKAGCRDIVLIGGLTRPTLGGLWPDWGAIRSIARSLHLFRGGDNHLLSIVVSALEHEGLRVVGAHEVAPNILIAPGPLGPHKPGARDQADIQRGLALLDAIGPFDVGQAVVIADQRVLAVEAAEGTDQMLERLAELREKGSIRSKSGTGVLVKAPKRGQDQRVDLPSIGPRTVQLAARAGLAGIAVVAGQTNVAEAGEVSDTADRAGLFVVGVDGPAAG